MNIEKRIVISLALALCATAIILPAAAVIDAATIQSPISISVDNYQSYQSQISSYAPFVVYGWLTDPYLAQNEARYQAQLDKLAAVDRVDKTLLFSSLATLRSKIADAEYWHGIGVTKLLYNTEGELTPEEEMATLNSPDQTVNAVALFAAAADEAGFSSSWGPIRNTADAVSDGAISAMLSGGLDGIGLQEQKFIEAQCAAVRYNVVKNTVTRYKKLAQGRTFAFQVQVMAGRCLNGDIYAKTNCKTEKVKKDYDHCRVFLNSIRAVNSEIGIFAMGTETENLPAFVAAIRKPATVLYLPTVGK